MVKQPNRDKAKDEPAVGPEPIVLMKHQQYEEENAENARHE